MSRLPGRCVRGDRSQFIPTPRLLKPGVGDGCVLEIGSAGGGSQHFQFPSP